MIQATPPSDTTAQEIAKILGSFSFDALRSEIDHKFEELRRGLEEQKAEQKPEEKPAEVVPAVPVSSVAFQIETAKIPVAAPKEEPEKKLPDYSDLIMSEEEEPVETEEKSTGGIDIMALLAAQAKKMESISTIEMMEMYNEEVAEVSLEELEKYINKKHNQ